MRRATDVVMAERDAAAKMQAWLGPPKPVKKITGRSPSGYAKAVASARARLQTGKGPTTHAWRTATVAELVGLYAVLHEQVYGVAPDELADVWLGAVSTCRRVLTHSPFNGDPEKLVDFLRFTWKRERNQVLRSAGQDRRRLGWRLQFAPSLVTDFKCAIIATQRTAANGKR